MPFQYKSNHFKHIGRNVLKYPAPFLMYTLRAIHSPIGRFRYFPTWFTLSNRVPNRA